MITVGAGTAAAKLKRRAKKKRQGSDNISKKIDLGAANMYKIRMYIYVCTSLQRSGIIGTITIQTQRKALPFGRLHICRNGR